MRKYIMNIYTKKIISIFNVSEKVARTIQFQMECSDFDFSEATDKKFKQEAEFAMMDIGLVL